MGNQGALADANDLRYERKLAIGLRHERKVGLKVLKPEPAARANKSRLPTGRMARGELFRALPLSVAGGGIGNFRVSMYGTLVGIEAPPASRNLEVMPYGIAESRTDLTLDPQISNDGYADAGLDVKYGITENLTADFTKINRLFRI